MNDVCCTKCSFTLPAQLLDQPNTVNCPKCNSKLMAFTFPALLQSRPIGHTGELVMVDGESSCFYHPQKKAVVPCDSCGRFLCALCEVEMNEQHLCAECIQKGITKGSLKSLERERVLYDRIALTLAVLPVALVAFWFVTFVTAPAALYISIRHWNSPTSIVRRGKWRFVVAIIVSVLEIAGWLILAFIIISHWNTR